MGQKEIIRQSEEASLEPGDNIKILINDSEQVNITVPAWSAQSNFSYKYFTSRS